MTTWTSNADEEKDTGRERRPWEAQRRCILLGKGAVLAALTALAMGAATVGAGGAGRSGHPQAFGHSPGPRFWANFSSFVEIPPTPSPEGVEEPR